MLRALLLAAFYCFTATVSSAQEYGYSLPHYTPTPSNIVEREKFQDRKFGLFIHWGLYSILGDGEWVMYNRKIPYDNYKRLADFFNPQQFDAKEWVQLAKRAGAKYITITSRHHDGFSMFKTKASPYNIVDATPFKRDPLLELAKEASKEGIELHFYYSLLDWGRPDYGFSKRISGGSPIDSDWKSYIAFMKSQLTELITNYPDVKAIWFDGHWERPDVNWHYNELYGLIHQLNPAILIGNNHHMNPLNGEDFQMFEKDLPGDNRTGYRKNGAIANMPLETCETINNSWGFNINDRSYKTVKQIIQMLVNAAGRNANLLLNVGPMPDGRIQPEFKDTLALVGDWLNRNGKTIYNTRGNVTSPQSWGVITVNDKSFYIHLLHKVNQPYIFIPAVKQRIKRASLFNAKTALRYKQQDEGVFIYLDNIQTNDIDTIIELQHESQ